MALRLMSLTVTRAASSAAAGSFSRCSSRAGGQIRTAGRDQEHDQTGELRRKTDHKQDAQDVEHAVEGDEADLGIEADPACFQGLGDMADRRQQKKSHHAGEQIVDHMGIAGPAGRDGTAERGKDRGGRRSHIHSDHKRCSLRKRDRTGRECGQGGGDTRARGLGNNRYGGADQDKLEAAEPGVAGEDIRTDAAFEKGQAVLKGIDTDEQQTETRKRRAGDLPCAGAENLQEHADEHERKHEKSEFQLEAENDDHPSGNRGADVRAENHTDCLGEGHEPGADEPDRGDCGRAGGLQQSGHDRPGDGAASWCRRRRSQDAPEPVSGQGPKAVGHELHTEQKQAEAAQGCQNGRVHVVLLVFSLLFYLQVYPPQASGSTAGQFAILAAEG